MVPITVIVIKYNIGFGASVARFGRLDSSSSGIHSYACSLVYSELS
jgi:hypothetical protein